MPNAKYIRSANKERELVNIARKDGAIAARSAGSHSPVDCWIFYPKEKEMRLIQVKTHKGKCPKNTTNGTGFVEIIDGVTVYLETKHFYSKRK